MDYILSTVCSGIGSPEQAATELSQETGIKHKIGFYCEINKFARASYEANFGAGFMVEDMTKEEWDGPEFYSDVFIGGIPCQAFSLAGLRKGELDPRGLLFYDFYRYVKKQSPKAFIIENVKGLLSDSNGKTFQNWLHLLGRSVNGHHQMFNSPDSLPYNLHWTVLNTKDFGIPQNRERVFLVGIRDDIPNTFRFPVGQTLKLRLKDILEPVVDEKYYLSDKMVAGLIQHQENSAEKGRGFKFEPKSPDTTLPASCIRANVAKMGPDDNYIKDEVLVSHERRTAEAKAERRATGSNSFRGKELVFEPSEVMNCLQTGLTNDHFIVVGNLPEGGHQPKILEQVIQLNPSKESGGQQPYKQNRIFDANAFSPALDTECGRPGYLVSEATKKGYDLAIEGDSINLSNPNSDTRRDRVGYQIANTLDTACNQAAVVNHRIRRLTPLECWRLQGFPDESFYNAQLFSLKESIEILIKFPKHKGKRILSGEERIERMSDTQLYKQAGNSMTKQVIKGVIKNILKCIFETA